MGIYLFHRWARLKLVWRFVGAWVGATGLTLLLLIWQIQALTPHYTDVISRPGGTYVEGIVGSISNLNPIYATTTADQIGARLLFGSLFAYDAQGQLQPDLAESIAVSESSDRRWRLKLKPGLVWHDGQPLTTADVAFTIKTIQTPASQSPLRTAWGGVDLELIDRLTVDFILPGSFSPFPHLLTVGIIPAHHLAEIDPADQRSAGFNQNPIGSGPFQFGRFVPLPPPTPGPLELRLELVANPNYHGGILATETDVRLAGFVLWMVATPERLIELFDRGYLTAVFGLSPDQVSLTSGRDYHDLRLSSRDGVYLFFKNSNQRLADPGFRRLLATGLDRGSLIDDWRPAARLDGPLLPDQVEIDDRPAPPEFDRTAFAAGLEALGYQTDSRGFWQRDGQPLQFTLTVPAATVYEELADLIVAAYGDVGILVQLDKRPAADFPRTVLNEHDYDDWLLYGLNLGSDPDVFTFWHSSQIDSHSILRLNLAEYRSTAADDALEFGRSRVDPRIRNSRYGDFYRLWLADMPAIPLYRPHLNYFIGANVQGPSDRQLVDRPSLYNDVSTWTVNIDRQWRPEADPN